MSRPSSAHSAAANAAEGMSVKGAPGRSIRSPADDDGPGSIPTVKMGGDLLDRPEMASGSLFSTLRMIKKQEVMARTMQAQQAQHPNVPMHSSMVIPHRRLDAPLSLEALLPVTAQDRDADNLANTSFDLAPPRFGDRKPPSFEPPTPSLAPAPFVSRCSDDGAFDLSSLLPTPSSAYSVHSPVAQPPADSPGPAFSGAIVNGSCGGSLQGSGDAQPPSSSLHDGNGSDGGDYECASLRARDGGQGENSGTPETEDVKVGQAQALAYLPSSEGLEGMPQDLVEPSPLSFADNEETNMLAATWAFQKCTADGGVGIDFEHLLGNSPEQLAQIQDALNKTLLEDEDEQDAAYSGEADAQPAYLPHEFPVDLLPLAGSGWGGIAPALPEEASEVGNGGEPTEPAGAAQEAEAAAATVQVAALAQLQTAAAKPAATEPSLPLAAGSFADLAGPAALSPPPLVLTALSNPCPLGLSARSEAPAQVPNPAAAAAATEALLGASIRQQKAAAGGSPAPLPTMNMSMRPAPKGEFETKADMMRSIRQEKKIEKLNTSIRVAFVNGKIKPLNIVVMVVGTRGDVQPFVGIGLKLKEYGHRVRIASHLVFREFVESFGLEFYPLGGDPKVLSEFVVKHRGIMPGLDIKDALNQREQVRLILYSTWGACVQADPNNPDKPFRADAIVSNPPAYGHIHCAEALNVPLHLVFTMPWTPTKAFPQPFARIKTTLGEGHGKAREIMNWLSYFAVEDLTWLGMSGMIKDFRQRVLNLKTWNKYTTSHCTYYSKVPMTYVWSPAMVARPRDWPSYIEVVGFVNVELNKLTSFSPPKELTDFLAAGPPPIYIGFGSLVMDEPEQLTLRFLTAITSIGVRAIIQRGWGGLGAGVKGKVPEGVLFIDGCPHDWLFPHMAAVVHHGGAGTTATGLYAGKPTFIVPFFGDQPFWGAACFQCGVGPEPVMIDDLTTPRITAALKDLLMPGRQKMALEMMRRMHQEDGIAGTVDHIHRSIYGATMANRPHMWMRAKAPQDLPLLTSVQEVPATPPVGGQSSQPSEEEGFLQGMLHLPGRLKRMFYKQSSSASAALAGQASKAPLTAPTSKLTGVPGSNVLPDTPSAGNPAATAATAAGTGQTVAPSAAVNGGSSVIHNRALASGNGSFAGQGACAAQAVGAGGGTDALMAEKCRAPSPVIAEESKRSGGFFSFLGC